MEYFIERLQNNSVEFRDKAALGNGENRIFSYEKVWELSGRVYRYLVENRIGKEDFVMINLPRGAETVIVCIGIWRAGAAAVIIEDGYPQERTNFIYSDCGCKKKIDKKVYELIKTIDPLEGFEKTDSHDAAYACYTSGSTGTPKGVLHEYGTIGQTIESFSYNTDCLLYENDIAAILAPLNFVLLFIIFPAILYVGGELLVVPSKYAKNIRLLESFIREERISVFFSAPSLLKLFSKFNPEIRLIFIGSDTVRNIYYENIPCVDAYAQSETGFYIAYFLINRPYDVTPIGKAAFPNLQIKILDEKCNELSKGEVGEICFDNPYFREYINHKDLTDYVKRGGIYHCGDMGKVLDDGNIVLLGRADDMVKINGNRVEPREVERVVQEILKVEWVYVKCVEHEERNVLVAYFLGEPAMPLADAREIISVRLPYYMVPSKYVMLDAIPQGPYGKIARNELPDPDFSSVSAYNSPQDDIENKMIRIWKKAFRRKRIGIDDDFFELGGDSILSLEVVSELNIRDFCAEDLFRERTVRKCAEYVRKKLIRDNKTDLYKRAKEIAGEGCRLTAYQQFYFNRQHYMPLSQQSTMLNIPLLFRYENIDVAELCEAVNRAIKAHPLLLTKIDYNEKGDLCQKYDKTLFEITEPVHLTEEEFQKEREELIKPFNLVGGKLYRIQVFNTEKYVYLFIDIHHIISDGTSIHILLKDIYKLYGGEKLRKDYIYMYLKREESRINDKYFRECKRYLESAYEGRDWSKIPICDYKSDTYESSFLLKPLSYDAKVIKKACNELEANENAFFLLTTILTLAKYNKKRNILITWTYHGRDTELKKGMFGLLIKDLVIALRLEKGMTVKCAIESVKMQIAGGIAHSLYPYSFDNVVSYENDILCFLFQQDIYEFPENEHFNAQRVDLKNQNLMAENSFSVQIITRGDRYYINVDYLKYFYDKSSIERFCDIFEEEMQLILNNENVY